MALAKMLRGKMLLAGLAMALGALAVWGVVRSRVWSPQRFASAMHAQINQAPEPQAIQLLDRLAAVEASASIPHLVQLLDDDRTAVRAATRELLRQQVAAGLLERRPEQQRALELLIHELARQPLPRDEREQAFIKQTALKLIYWPTEELQIDGAQVLLDCTSLLQRLTLSPLPERILTAQRTEKIYEPPPVFERVLPADEIVLPPEPPATIEVVPLPRPPVSVSLSDDPTEPAPGVLPLEGNEARLPPERFYPQSPDKLKSETSLADEAAPAPEPQPTLPPSVTPATPVEPAVELDMTKFRELNTRALIRHLHGLPEISETAAALLKERGFDAATLTLAKMLDDPDPQIRKTLVEALPTASHLQAAAWLFELTRDRDAQVSAAAKAILSTSRNPFTQRRLNFTPTR
jgi:hypothetical protein